MIAVHIIWAVYGALMGAALASYGCVIAERVPRGETLGGRSHCACGRQLRAVELVPVLGWLACRGRARCCGAKLPAGYLVAELIAGVLGGISAGAGSVVAARGSLLGGVTLAVAGLAVCLGATVILRWPRGLTSRTEKPKEGRVTITLDEVRALARRAHAGQTDKLGRDYYTGHLDPIAAALTDHGQHAVMAGLLHDILEDTSVTADELLERGVPAEVVQAVESVSKRAGETYDDLITRASADPLGRLVKLADNAHNLASNDHLALSDPETAARLRVKYESARQRLLAAGDGSLS